MPVASRAQSLNTRRGEQCHGCNTTWTMVGLFLADSLSYVARQPSFARLDSRGGCPHMDFDAARRTIYSFTSTSFKAPVFTS